MNVFIKYVEVIWVTAVARFDIDGLVVVFCVSSLLLDRTAASSQPGSFLLLIIPD